MKLPRVLWGIVAGHILLRLGLIATGGPPERFEYDDLARNLLSGRGYVYDQLGTPYRSFYAGVPYIALDTLTDLTFPNRPSAVLVMQSLYAGALTVVAFLVARSLFNERLALWAAALVGLHPALVYYDTHKLHPLGFDALAMSAAILMVLTLRASDRFWHVLAAGVVVGLAILQRGSMLLFFVATVVWIAARWSEPRWPRIVAYTMGALLVLAPVLIRNYAIHHMVLLESMTAQQFWKGNATYSNGSGYLPDGRNVYDAAPPRVAAEWQRRDETAQFRLFRAEGINEVRQDPIRAMGLMLRKFTYFWTAPPNSGQLYPARYASAYFAYYGAVALLTAIGLAAALRDPTARLGALLILTFFATTSIVHAIMFVELRHRWAIEPMMLVFVPAGALAAGRRLGSRLAR